MELLVTRAEPRELSTCLTLRLRVFVEEQNVPAELEVDGLDAEAVHYLGWLDGEAVATARTRWLEGKEVAKVERVAVLPAFRGRGFGHRIMDAVERDLAEGGALQIVLSAQVGAIRFYEVRGYRAEGAPFWEAGIEHRKMRRLLADGP
ncbi:MAG: GNAT family N-acetyltransferase [Myxococcales bacterium]|nr:GNAT family N-acetyltransferase [Myxococcales bacterium]